MNMNDISGHNDDSLNPGDDQLEYVQMESGQNTANHSFQLLNQTTSGNKMIIVSPHAAPTFIGVRKNEESKDFSIFYMFVIWYFL